MIPNPDKEQNEKKKNLKSEENLKDLLENIKYNSIHITEVSEGAERKNALEKLFKEIVTENIPNLGRKQICTSRKPRKFQRRQSQSEKH